jgi:2-dehydro-3-deoxygalactonokinase
MTRFIGVEWGTARLRARLFDAEGGTLACLEEAVKLADLDRDAMAERIAQIAAAWPDAAAEGMLLSGMIGSAMGWAEVPRVPCPATPEMLAAHAVRDRIGDQPVTFLPGLSCRSRFGDADVMRGEELAAVGALASLGARPATLLSVPGMHGKWLRLGDGAVRDFHSAMTVELHRAIAQGTVLAPLMQAPVAAESEAFRCGAARAAEGGALARLLFSARSRVQAGEMDADAASAYLWGVLIGADVRDGVADTAGRCLVIGAPEVAPLFAQALALFDVAAEVLDDQAVTAAGFRHLAALLEDRG